MYIYGRKFSGAQPSQAKSLADDLKTHITENGSFEVEVRVEEERRNLGRTLVIIAENHSAETRSSDLARRLMKNDVYRFIASEYFYNAGSLRTEIRDFGAPARRWVACSVRTRISCGISGSSPGTSSSSDRAQKRGTSVTEESRVTSWRRARIGS